MSSSIHFHSALIGACLAAIAASACAAPVSRSDIGRLGFIHSADRSDDPFYTQMIDKIADIAGTGCAASEAFGWKVKAGDQRTLDDIVRSVMDALQVRGYAPKPVNIPIEGVLAFDAKSGDPTAEDPRLIVAWQLGETDVHLVLCRAKQGSDR